LADAFIKFAKIRNMVFCSSIHKGC